MGKRGGKRGKAREGSEEKKREEGVKGVEADKEREQKSEGRER